MENSVKKLWVLFNNTSVGVAYIVETEEDKVKGEDEKIDKNKIARLSLDGCDNFIIYKVKSEASAVCLKLNKKYATEKELEDF